MVSRSLISRIIKVTTLRLILLIGIVYVFLIWLSYKHLERNMSHMQQKGQVFRPKIKQDGSFQIYAKECQKIHNTRHNDFSQFSGLLKVKSLEPGVCHVPVQPLRPDIQMEEEWNDIGVGYPQYVYTISGWIQVIDVPNYDAKPLKVIIVPHSHQDPGWRETFDSYFNSYTRSTLDYIVKFLGENPTWKFIWSEVSYLEKWFNLPSSKVDQFKRLIENGQLEVVSGGWVMSDEAVSHYTSMLDQMIEGHLWLHKNLGITPNVSWSIDPFGHSPTMTYMLNGAQIHHMVIQRVHFAIKRHFAKLKNLEFFWRQAWDSEGKTGVFCHMMPFLLYSILYSCGPDPHVCCQFDFHSDKCFRGKKTVPKITVDETNIKTLAWALWEQFQKKATLYRTDTLLVPHGDDFRYGSESEWSQQFDNLGRLMEFMNKEKDMNIQVKFGTISDYFNAMEVNRQVSKPSIPSFTGDFLPYNDRDDQYWTGFYSVRPLLKHMDRVLHAKLRLAEILFTLSRALSSVSDQSFYSQNEQVLVEVRRTIGLFQHHDAITGTSKKVVMADYGIRLKTALDKVDSLLALLMLNSLLPKAERAHTLPPKTIFLTEEWSSSTALPSLRTLNLNGKWVVVVLNPQTTAWSSPITFRTTGVFGVKAKSGSLITSQINPVLGQGMLPLLGVYDILFMADVPALAIETYELVEDISMMHYASVTIFGNHTIPAAFSLGFKAVSSNKEIIEIESVLLKATFSACTGTIQYLLQKSDGILHKASIQMMTYGTGSWINPFKDKSGAYIFMPDGHAEDLESLYPSIVVFKGPIMSSVISELPGVQHSTTLYHTAGPTGAGIHIDNLVDLTNSSWANKELVMRIETDVSSRDTSLCVDLNGYQVFKDGGSREYEGPILVLSNFLFDSYMHRKKWRSKFLIQGNFHPVTSIAFMEDGKKNRMTLLTAQPHGVASLRPGFMEVILDRRLMQDDWRGLNEGAQDNKVNPSRFILLPEKRDTAGQTKGATCYPSTLAHLLSSHLHNPPQVAVMSRPHGIFEPQVRFQNETWPCSCKLLNLRNLGTGNSSSLKALLVVHRVGLDCSYSQIYTDCNKEEKVTLNVFGGVQIKTAVETTLTGVQELTPLNDLKLQLNDMEIKTVKLTYR